MKVDKSAPVQGPSGAAGLVRYFDISGGGFEVTPEIVFGISIFFIAAELAAWFIF
jgi:preprotein translocase subunit Sec61beta